MNSVDFSFFFVIFPSFLSVFITFFFHYFVSCFLSLLSMSSFLLFEKSSLPSSLPFFYFFPSLFSCLPILMFWCHPILSPLSSFSFLFFFTLASFLLLLLPCFLPTVPHSPSLSPTTSFPWCPSSRWHSRASAWSSPCHGCVPAVPPPASPSSSPSLPRHHAAQSQPQW